MCFTDIAGLSRRLAISTKLRAALVFVRPRGGCCQTGPHSCKAWPRNILPGRLAAVIRSALWPFCWGGASLWRADRCSAAVAYLCKFSRSLRCWHSLGSGAGSPSFSGFGCLGLVGSLQRRRRGLSAFGPPCSKAAFSSEPRSRSLCISGLGETALFHA